MSVVTQRSESGVGAGGSVGNLLRATRTECLADAVFIAGTDPDGSIARWVVPEVGGILDADAIESLARQAALDPEFAHGGAFVRRVVIDDEVAPMTLAACSLSAGVQGALGALVTGDGSFGRAELDLLEKVAWRVSRHLLARRQLIGAVPISEAVPTASTTVEQRSDTPDGLIVGTPEQPVPAQVRSSAAPPERSAVAIAPPEPWAVDPPEHREPKMRATPAPSDKSSRAPADVGVSVWRVEDDNPTLPRDGRADARRSAWGEPDAATGLVGVGSFFSRLGRLLGATAGTASAVVVVAVDLRGVGEDREQALGAAARALRQELRYSDPIARVGEGTLAAAAAVVPGATRPDAVAGHLAESVGRALGMPGAVSYGHVVASNGDEREADELVEDALGLLRA